MLEKKDLYTRAYQLEQEILTLQEDLKNLKGEFTYHKEENTEGFPKDEVSELMKAAKAKAKADDLLGKAEEFKKLQQLQELYSE